MLKATLCPWPTVPSTFSTGTRTLSKMSAVVDEPSRPSFGSFSRPLTPMSRLDDESSKLLAVNFSENGEHVSEAAVGDPHLRLLRT